MAGISDIYAALRDGVIGINNLTQQIATIFPQFTGTSSSATAGTALLPGAPMTFIDVTLPDGTQGKVPVYKP